jgi:hypothetical protein
MERFGRLVFSSLLLVTLTACTYGGHPWRLEQTAGGWLPKQPPATAFDFEHPSADLATQTWEKFKTFDLGIVEFKDDGTVWSDAQQGMVVDRVREIAREGATIVVYVHGWHHNARVDDDNLVSFRRVLATIAAQRHVGMTCGDPTESNNRVVGVYVGWRGESSQNKVLTWLTIWDRKRTAHRIGGPSTALESFMNAKGGLLGLLHELEDIRTSANNKIHARDQRFTSLTIVGHSLGGAMLLSAMQQIVFENKKPHFTGAARPLQTGVGDLVVLLNPAVEARRYGFFETVVARGATFDPSQAPVLVTISSKGDWPDKWPFWIARFITTLHSPQRWYEPVRSTVNLGFRATWKTHELSMAENVADEIDHKKPFLFTDLDYYPDDTNPASSPDNLAGDAKFYGGKVCLAKRNDLNLAPNAPFLIVQGTTDIIKGHNDIFSNRLLTFLLPYATATQRKRVNAFCKSHIGPGVLPAAATE